MTMDSLLRRRPNASGELPGEPRFDRVNEGKQDGIEIGLHPAHLAERCLHHHALLASFQLFVCVSWLPR